MSAGRRTRAPRKRPEPGPNLAERVQQGAVDGTAATAQPDAVQAAGAQLRDKVRGQFEAALQNNRDLDDEGRDFLLEHFRKAVENAPIDPSVIARPDRGAWVEMLESLHADGLAGDDKVADLVRQFDAAMDPLDSPKLDTAVEFARRCERDGEEEALAWMESRREAAEESKRATSATNLDARPKPAKSRVRRVRSPRGPPA